MTIHTISCMYKYMLNMRRLINIVHWGCSEVRKRQRRVTNPSNFNGVCPTLYWNDQSNRDVIKDAQPVGKRWHRTTELTSWGTTIKKILIASVRLPWKNNETKIKDAQMVGKRWHRATELTSWGTTINYVFDCVYVRRSWKKMRENGNGH